MLRAEGEEEDDDDEGKKKGKMANMVVSDKTRPSTEEERGGRGQQFLVTSQVMADIGRVPIKVRKAMSEENR